MPAAASRPVAECCSGIGNGNGRRDGLQGDHDVLQRIHPDGVLPAHLVGVGRPERAVPADAVDHLHVEQVEVDEVGVHAVVGDLPELRLAVPDDLGGRIDVAEGIVVWVEEVGERQLDAQGGIHPAIIQRKEFLDGLLAQIGALRRWSVVPHEVPRSAVSSGRRSAVRSA